MPRICYVPKKFAPKSQLLIAHAHKIIEEYMAAGYTLTLRQLYYQFVARDLIANKQTEYKRLGSVINDARLAGLIDWSAIEDRTRNLESLPHWDGPGEIVRACSKQFRYDKWQDQPYRIEVWVEKEALAGVFERVCRSLDIPYLACRGYMSQSEMWRAAVRLSHYAKGTTPESLGPVNPRQKTIILHFGDHDPSGIDMTRDIQNRLQVLDDWNTDVRRIALNMDQVEEYNPPPNPAKLTDARADAYVREYGYESWELDALEPAILEQLVRDEVDKVLDVDLMEAMEERQEEARQEIKDVADEHWEDEDDE